MLDNISATKIQPELRLIAMLSLPQLTEQQKRKVRHLLESPLDIETLAQLPHRHRVWPSVYTNIRDHFNDKFPLQFVDNLHAKYLKNIIRNKILLKTLLTLIRGFNLAGIPVASVKGISLAQSLYGDLAKRHFKDIDLLIHSCDLTRANKVLNNLGFRCVIVDEFPSYLILKLQNRNKDLEYVNPAGVIVELHFRLNDISTSLTDTYTQLLLTNSQHAVLYRHEAFLYLCCHGMNTFFHRLKWLCDLAIMIETMDFDWEKMYVTARKMDCHRTLTISLVLSHLIFETVIPHRAAELYSMDRVCRWLVMRALKTIGAKSVSSTVNINYLLTFIVLPTSWVGKIKGAMVLCHPSYDDLKILPYLPKKLGVVYNFIRPATFLWRRLQYARK